MWLQWSARKKDGVREEVARGHIILGFVSPASDLGFSSEGSDKGSEVSEERGDKILKASLAPVLRVDHRGQRKQQGDLVNNCHKYAGLCG